MHEQPSSVFDGFVNGGSRARALDAVRVRNAYLAPESLIPEADLKPVSKLGEGTFGSVWACKYSGPKKLDEGANGVVAAKRLRLRPDASASERDIANFAAELVLLKACASVHVVRFIGCVGYKDGTFALVTEHAAHGSLLPLISTSSKLKCPYTTADGLRWASHLASALAFLHGCTPPVIHRNVKPENVLLCGPTAIAKLADFGLATFAAGRCASVGMVVPFSLDDDDNDDARRPAAPSATPDARTPALRGRLTGRRGALQYVAPEVFRGEPFAHSADTFSFAVIAFELLQRHAAYTELYMMQEQIAEHVASARALRPTLPAVWPESVKALFTSMWAAAPSSRPECSHVLATLAGWRADAGSTVLAQIVQGSRRGVLELSGFSKAMLRTTFGERQHKTLPASPSESGASSVSTALAKRYLVADAEMEAKAKAEA